MEPKENTVNDNDDQNISYVVIYIAQHFDRKTFKMTANKILESFFRLGYRHPQEQVELSNNPVQSAINATRQLLANFKNLNNNASLFGQLFTK